MGLQRIMGLVVVADIPRISHDAPSAVAPRRPVLGAPMKWSEYGELFQISVGSSDEAQRIKRDSSRYLVSKTS